MQMQPSHHYLSFTFHFVPWNHGPGQCQAVLSVQAFLKTDKLDFHGDF